MVWRPLPPVASACPPSASVSNAIVIRHFWPRSSVMNGLPDSVSITPSRHHRSTPSAVAVSSAVRSASNPRTILVAHAS